MEKNNNMVAGVLFKFESAHSNDYCLSFSD